MVNALRILIVDDQRRARQSLKALLATKFKLIEMLEAENGVEVIRRVDEFRPHIVLSMDGEYRAAALTAGADAFISKGEPPERLLEVLATTAGDDPRTEREL